jgi:hypothetical protein
MLVGSSNPKAIFKAVLILSGLLFYDTLWDLFLSLLHHLFGLLHLVFDFCEHTLERLFEHLFHVDPRTAEVMVFYTMLSIGAFAAFRLIQKIPRWVDVLAHRLTVTWQQAKAESLQYWHEQTIQGKFQWGAVFMSALLVIILWLSS